VGHGHSRSRADRRVDSRLHRCGTRGLSEYRDGIGGFIGILHDTDLVAQRAHGPVLPDTSTSEKAKPLASRLVRTCRLVMSRISPHPVGLAAVA
jgi:hypothetical protein